MGRSRSFGDAETVWGIGDRSTSLFVVVVGAIEAYESRGPGREHQIVVRLEDEFTGDINLLSSAATVIGARAFGLTATIEWQEE